MNLRAVAVLAITSSFWLLSGCNSEKSEVESAVRSILNDPDSAKFGDFYMNERSGSGCLVVNAKNSMGGYSGNQVANIYKIKGKYVADLGFSLPFELCKTFAADKNEK